MWNCFLNYFYSVVLFGSEDGIDFLFKSFVFRDLKDDEGMMFFFCVVVVGYIRCVELFLDCGVNIIVCDKY